MHVDDSDVNEAHLVHLRSLPCCSCGADPAYTAHHSTHLVHGRGEGHRAPDWAAMPLCDACHRSFHSRMFGPFKGWTKAQANAWQDRMVETYRPRSDGNSPESDGNIF